MSIRYYIRVENRILLVSNVILENFIEKIEVCMPEDAFCFESCYENCFMINLDLCQLCQCFFILQLSSKSYS